MAEARLIARVQTQGARQSARELQQFSQQGKAAETQAKKLSKASADSDKKLGMFGRRAGQAGIQVQQLVGQVKGGVDPFVAFSQQAADLGFVLGVPLAGAIIGIAAAFGGTLLPALFDSKDATEELEEALKALGEIAEFTDGNIVGLTDTVQQLAKVSKQAARLEIARGMLEAQKVIEASSDVIQERSSDLLSTFTVNEKQLASLAMQYKETGKSLLDAFPETAKWPDTFNFPVLIEGLGNLRDELGLTNQEAADLLDALSDQIENKTAKSAEKLGEVVAQIGLKYGTTNKEVLALTAALSQEASTISKVSMMYERLNKMLKETDEALFTNRQDSIDRRFALEQARVAAEEQLSLDQLNHEMEMLDRKEKLQKEYREREMQAELDFINSGKDLESRNAEERLADFAANSDAIIGSFADSAAMLGGEGSSAYKALFVAQKAFSLASTIMAMSQASAQAAADPSAVTTAQKVANIAMITSQIAGLVSAIKGTNYSARAQGGQFRAGQNLLVGEKGPELVQFGSGGRIANAEQTAGMNGSSPSITIINQTSGRIDETQVQRDSDGNIAIIAREVMNRELLNPNSQFNKNFDRTRQAPRRF